MLISISRYLAFQLLQFVLIPLNISVSVWSIDYHSFSCALSNSTKAKLFLKSLKKMFVLDSHKSSKRRFTTPGHHTSAANFARCRCLSWVRDIPSCKLLILCPRKTVVLKTVNAAPHWSWKKIEWNWCTNVRKGWVLQKDYSLDSHENSKNSPLWFCRMMHLLQLNLTESANSKFRAKISKTNQQVSSSNYCSAWYLADWAVGRVG